MIPNCPGRYNVRRRKSVPVLLREHDPSHLDPHTLLSLVFGEEAVQTMHVHELQSAKCVDPVSVVVFADAGGGGLMTYCKQVVASDHSGHDGGTAADVEGSSPLQSTSFVYVHTLNTASGLARKLGGLGIDHVLHNHDGDDS